VLKSVDRRAKALGISRNRLIRPHRHVCRARVNRTTLPRHLLAYAPGTRNK
jgi:hypothetical protein